MSPSWRGSPRCRRAATRTRACRTRSAAMTSGPRRRALPARVQRKRAREHRRRLLRHDAGAHRAIAASGSRPAAAPTAGAGDAAALRGLEPFSVVGDDTGFVMVGERTNVTGSARFRRLIEAGRLQAPSTWRWSRCAAAPTSST